MESFKVKYPAFAALFGMIGSLVTGLEIKGETLVQKLEGSIVLVPQVLAFLPQASLLGSEVVALKAAPVDIEGGIEMLITELAFSSDKAKLIIAAAFPLAESVAAVVPQAQAFVAAVKA